MITLLLGVALAGTATLHVGVHREAGTIYDVSADGAAGQCVVATTWIRCPAQGPVTFRWGPGGSFSLTGDDPSAREVTVEPGAVAVGWVLASEEARLDARRRLAERPLLPETVRALFVRTGAEEAPAPSRGMLVDLVALADHEDPRVRQAVIDAMVPMWRRTASDPLPPGAPNPLPARLVDAMSADPDHRVRRRLAARLRELRTANDATTRAADEALARLIVDERGGVARAATASLSVLTVQDPGGATPDDLFPAERTFAEALERVSRPGPAGRAAANSLGRVRPWLDPEAVDGAEAVHRVLLHHPERAWHVWSAWRADVPFRRDWVERLLRETVGLDRRLLRHWADHEPAALAAALQPWQGTWDPGPAEERFQVLRAWLSDASDPELRRVLGVDGHER